MTTVSTETYIDVFEHDFNRLVHVWQTWSSGHFHSFIWIRRCYHVSGLYFKCLDGELRTDREHFASYLRNIIQRIRNVLHVTGRRWYNIPGTSLKVLEEAVTTCQERLASYLQKISQRIRNILQVTWRRCFNVSGTSGKLLEEKFTTYQEGRASYLQVGRCCKYQERLACYLTKMLQHTRTINQGSWRSCDNVPWTSCKLLAEEFTMYQERVASHLKKMLQRIRNIWQVTWRKVYDVPGGSCKLLASRKMLHVAGKSCMLLDEDATTYKDHHSSYLKKMWQRARNVLQVTCRRFHSVSGTCCKSPEEGWWFE